MTKREQVVPYLQARKDAVKRPMVDKKCLACGKPVGEWPIAFRGDKGCSVVCQGIVERQEEAARSAGEEDGSEPADAYVERTTCPGCGNRVTGAMKRVQVEGTYWHESCYDLAEEREKARSGS